MAGKDRRKAAALTGALTAAGLIALLSQRPVGAQPPAGSTLVTLDDTAMQALASLLAHTEGIGEDFDETLGTLGGVRDAINALALALGVPGAVPSLQNPRYIVAWQTMCPAALTAYQLPAMIIPWDKAIAIKALPANVGVIRVGRSSASAVSVNNSYPLIANEAVMYKIHDAQNIWVSATIAGDGVACTSEQDQL